MPIWGWDDYDARLVLVRFTPLLRKKKRRQVWHGRSVRRREEKETKRQGEEEKRREGEEEKRRKGEEAIEKRRMKTKKKSKKKIHIYPHSPKCNTTHISTHTHNIHTYLLFHS
jgi:hypothetical protein